MPFKKNDPYTKLISSRPRNRPKIKTELKEFRKEFPNEFLEAYKNHLNSSMKELLVKSKDNSIDALNSGVIKSIINFAENGDLRHIQFFLETMMGKNGVNIESIENVNTGGRTINIITPEKYKEMTSKTNEN